MATSRIEVKGLREIAIAARKLTDEVQKKIAGNAVLAGARIVRNAARGLAPMLQAKYQTDKRRTPGLLRRKLVAVRVRKGDFPEEVVAIVGVRMLSKGAIAKFKKGAGGKSGAANPQDPFYWWFVEAGTRGHRRRQVSIPGTRFLKRGFESNAERAAHEIRDRAGKDIIKYGNTLAR